MEITKRKYKQKEVLEMFNACETEYKAKLAEQKSKIYELSKKNELISGELQGLKDREEQAVKAIMDAENLRIYTYNDERFYTAEQKILKNKEAKHDPYIEAIAGAIYYDKGFDAAKQWWKRWLFPLTEKHKKQ